MSDEQLEQGDPPKAEAKNEVEILARALADTSKEANSSNKNTVRVLGVLLAFSVLGNIALAGLNIHGTFFGSEVKMGTVAEDDIQLPTAPEYFPAFEDIDTVDFSTIPESVERPTQTWCVEMDDLGLGHPSDMAWCDALYPSE